MDIAGNTEGQVISMNQRGDGRRHPALAGVEGYWQALRDGDGIPFRSQISPRGLEHALEYAFVLERIAPGIARLRIAGSHLVALMGMEVRGMPLTAFFNATARPHVSEAVESVFSDSAMADLQVAAPRGLGRPGLEGQMLLLPLRSDSGAVDRALGCLVTEGAIGRQPRQLTLSSAEMRDPPAPAQKPAAFAEAAAVYQPRPDVPYLRLVKTDRS